MEEQNAGKGIVWGILLSIPIWIAIISLIYWVEHLL